MMDTMHAWRMQEHNRLPGAMRADQPFTGQCRRKFADGFPNLFVKDATRIRNRHVAFLASFQDAGSIFEQLSIIYQMPRMFVSSFTLVLPYFPTGTAERVLAPPL